MIALLKGLSFLFVCFVLTGASAMHSLQEAPASALIDSRQLLLDLKTLSADDMQGRQAGTPGGEKARAFVIQRFRESGITPVGTSYELPFTFTSRGGERLGVNVAGQIVGTSAKAKYVVVSAHYDHLGVRNGKVFNGADDNASGTAALFAIAKYFAAHKPANSLLFVAFDAEESGLRGSQAFVKHPPVDPALLSLDLNPDMIGREENNRLFVVGTALQPFLKPMIDAIAATAPVKLLTGHEDPTQPEDWTRDSDHYSFIQAKVPALYFGVEDFEQHHKTTDDFETISYGFYARAVETLVKAVQYFDLHLAEVDRLKK